MQLFQVVIMFQHHVPLCNQFHLANISNHLSTWPSQELHSTLPLWVPFAALFFLNLSGRRTWLSLPGIMAGQTEEVETVQADLRL